MSARGGVKGHLADLTAQIMGADADAADVATTASPRVRGSGAIGAPNELAQFSVGYQELERKVEVLEGQKGRAIRVRMDLCDEGPHHTMPVDPERVEKLKLNIKENGQSSPALLRRKTDGRFEILAGRHRKVAMTELGEQEWDAVLKDVDDDQAERLTFYDNLLAPNLTDYARFMGFSRRKQSRGLTDQQLADESGVSRTTIVRLMSFQNLPGRALKAIAGMPTKVAALVSGNFVMDLAKLVPKHATRVDEAMEQLAVGTMAISDVLKWVENSQPAKAAPPQINPHIVRLGKTTFAKVSRKEGRVIIDFADKEQAEALEKAFIALLDEQVRKLTSKGEKSLRK
jgi:ParB family chromosome partitioning protein